MIQHLRKGFSLIELVVVIGVGLILGAIFIPNLQGRRGLTELNITSRQMVALLREAQTKALLESSSTAWGVHFENSTTSPFYALFSGTYSTTTISTRALLPLRIRYASSSLAVGQSREVLFAQRTGKPSTSSTVTIELKNNIGSLTSSTISVSTAGAVSF